MSRSHAPSLESEVEPGVDPEGELYTSPAGLSYVWAALLVVCALEAANELFGIGGPPALYEVWFHDLILAVTAALVLARAAFEPSTRPAWLAFGAAMALWCMGTIAWSLAYGGDLHPPYPTFADVLWLVWYPLMTVGIICLIRRRVPRFELHRWMDGIAVILVVLVAGFGLVVQPVAAQAAQGKLATIVDFSYPVLDILLMGVILGVYGLLGWKPDRMWIFIGLGILTMTIADAAFAVQEARGVADDNHYDFVWTVGALFIAYAAWVRAPEVGDRADQVTGLRAVALPLLGQALAGGIQIYALFHRVGNSERVITLAVLAVSSAQIYLNRPRAGPTTAGSVPARPLAVADSSAPQRLSGLVARGTTTDPAGTQAIEPVIGPHRTRVGRWAKRRS